MPGKSHGRRSLVGCSPWGCWGSDMTERLHFQFSLSCIGGGNGDPLQCSYLENPRDGGAWWAAVYGVAQSRTRLKRLSSSSSSMHAKSFQLCPTLWDSMDGSLPDFSVHGILLARILCPHPGDLPNPGIEPASPMSPALAEGFLTTSSTWEAHIYTYILC